MGAWGGCHLHGIGGDQKVGIVKECHTGHLDDEHVDELDGQHERQLPDAADLQEHGAGQQAEQHAVGEVLWETAGFRDRPLPGPRPPASQPPSSWTQVKPGLGISLQMQTCDMMQRTLIRNQEVGLQAELDGSWL